MPMHRLGNHKRVQKIQPVGFHVYTADISTFAITMLMLQESHKTI